jgi:hypothetical protein
MVISWGFHWDFMEISDFSKYPPVSSTMAEKSGKNYGADGMVTRIKKGIVNINLLVRFT